MFKTYSYSRKAHRTMKVGIVEIALIFLMITGNIVAMSIKSNEVQVKDNSTLISQISKSTRANSRFCSLNDEACCEEAYIYFTQNWKDGDLHLTHLLENFRRSNCSHFTFQCQERTFAYTNYSALVYDRFCDYKAFRNFCKEGRFFLFLFFLLAIRK